jgi:hypothetical protein
VVPPAFAVKRNAAPPLAARPKFTRLPANRLPAPNRLQIYCRPTYEVAEDYLMDQTQVRCMWV